MVHVLAGRGLDDIFQVLGADGIFLVGQLQQLDLVHRRPGTFSKLLGNISALQTRHNVKTVGSDNARYLPYGNICISTEVRNVARIVLVGKYKPNRVSMVLQRLVRTANACLKFFKWRHVLAIN